MRATDEREQIYRMGGWSPDCGRHGGCGLEVHVKDGKVVKVEGDPEHPWYQGCTVVWGSSAIRGRVDHYWSDHWFIDLMRQGAKVIVIDPRETWIATRADLFLQLRPGSDNALALAMLDVVCEEDLVDHDFVDTWCHGYAELKERVKHFTPEWAAPITWLTADKIREAARM